MDTYRTTGSTCERCPNQLQGLANGSENVVPGQQPLVQENGVVYGSVRVLASSGVTHMAAGVEAHLSLKGGRLQGTVRNRGQSPIENLTLFATDGDVLRKATVASSIRPGRTVQVDVPIAAETAPAGTTADRELRSVALSEIAGGDGPVLTGFTAASPSGLTVDGASPQLTSVAVLDQPVRLEAADDLLRYFERKRLAGSDGQSGAGYQDVYDVQLPDTSKPLQLTFNRDLSSQLEIYDFAQGRFTSAGTPETDVLTTVPLSPQQVSGGMVRVRFREARLFQGSGFQVEVAG
jgi:hypothetical protein